MTHHLWRHHPGVRAGDDLTFGERAADRMRNLMGSWQFVGWSLAFLAAWILAARGLHAPIDNSGLTILNLLLSCFAALQGAIILLAAKRADAVTAELATAHYAETKSIDDNGVTLLALNRQQLAILHELRELRALVEAQDDDMKGGIPMTEPDFIPPHPDEPVPEPPPAGATDVGLGGVEVTPEEMDFAEQAFIAELLAVPVAAVAGAPTWGQVYALARAQLASVVRGRVRENVNPFTEWYYGTSAIAAAWCFIFISWCLAHAAATQAAGLSLLGGKYAYVPWIDRIRGFHSGHSGMRVGAIVAVNGFGHIGFCTYISGSTFHLLSGNSTSSAGSDAVTVKSYDVSIADGYVNLAYATTPTPTPTPVPAPAVAGQGNAWMFGGVA